MCFVVSVHCSSISKPSGATKHVVLRMLNFPKWHNTSIPVTAKPNGATSKKLNNDTVNGRINTILQNAVTKKVDKKIKAKVQRKKTKIFKKMYPENSKIFSCLMNASPTTTSPLRSTMTSTTPTKSAGFRLNIFTSRNWGHK